MSWFITQLRSYSKTLRYWKSKRSRGRLLEKCMQGRSRNLQRWQLKFVDVAPILWTVRIIERWEGVRIGKKKELGAGDVYSAIDDGVMMAQLQSGWSLSYQGFFPICYTYFPRNTKKDDEISMMTMGEWINDYESCNKFIMPHLMYEME